MFQMPIGHRGLVNLTGCVLSICDVFRDRQWLAACLMLVQLVGCNGLQKKHDNPVLGDAPVRLPHSEIEAQFAEADPSGEGPGVTTIRDGVTPVGGTNGSKLKLDRWESWEDDTAIYNSKVAATVNGAPILNGDVLDRYSGYLIGMRKSMQQNRVPPSEYEKAREALIQRDLTGHIQRRLLVESMKSSLKAEQMKMLNQHLDGLFEREVEKLKRELNVSTRTELELELNKKGTTLQNVKDSFNTERMAMEYVAIKMDKAEHIDRQDLIDYYQAHLDDYAIAASTTWEQIQVSFDEKSPKAKAQERIQEAKRELAKGTPFDVVAKKYSDGPTAKQGGLREAMEVGSLTDKTLEKMLFNMPINKLSDIHEGPSEFQIVRVKSRSEAGRKELGDVQDEIRQKLENDQNKKRPEKLFKKLFSEAIIETKYDVPGLAS